MKRKKMTAHDEYVKKILSILDRFSPKELLLMDSASVEIADPYEQLFQRLNFLLDDRRNTLGDLERMEKELAVFRNVNAETSRLLEKKIEELSLLRLITDTTSRAVTAEDPFKPILDKVITIVGADIGFLTILNPETGISELHTASAADPGFDQQMLLNIVAHIANDVAPAHLSTRVHEICPLPLPAKATGAPREIRSQASFPLVVEEKSVGMLTMCNFYPDAFNDETKRIMHIIAGQIAITVQNALLYGEVKKTKEYLENLVERAGDAIFTLDRSHAVVSWNNGAETIFKQGKSDVLGKPVYALVPESAAAELKDHIGSVLYSESIITTEMDAVRNNGEMAQIALTLSPIRGADGDVVGVSGIAKDITARKRVEEELRRLNEAKSQFVSTVSHELRTPLTSIKSYVQILLQELDALPKDTTYNYLTIMNDECDRLSALITNVLDLQKLEAGMLEAKLEPLLLADIVRQASVLFNGITVPNRIALDSELVVPDHMTKILGDRKRLIQILSNLLSNAIKYTQAGGHVRITVNRDSGGVLMTVSDDGIGIPPSEIDKVFERFYQVDNQITRAKGGTGLGLAITRELVTLQGGRIWVESEVGRGCRFSVVFPAAE